MNPLLLGGAALAAMLLLGGGKKAKASAAPARSTPTPDEEEAPLRVEVPEHPLDKPVVRKQAEVEQYVVEEGGKQVQASTPTARELAPAIAAELRGKGSKYNRDKLAVWQALAGIAADGLYGPQTRATLGKYVSNPPPIVFKGASR